MARLVIDKERNLILNSDILNDYPKFKAFLEDTPTLDESEINTLDDDMINFFKGGIFKAVSSRAPKEWEVDKSKTLQIKEKEIKNCQLCNHPIKYLCYIRNKINNNYMVVGSSCVMQFGILDKSELDKLLKEREVIKRREEINKLINNIEKTLQELELFIEKSPIVIKNEIINKYRCLKDETFRLYNKFINFNLSNVEKAEVINTIKENLSQIQLEKYKIIKYIDKNKNNKFVATKEIFKGLDYNEPCRNSLEEDGFVSNKNIFKIKDIKFITSVSDDFNKYLMNYSMKIIGTFELSRDIYYQIDIGNKGYAIVDYKYEDFAFNYGSLLFGKEPLEFISIDNIFKNSKIRNEKTITAILNSIEEILEKRDFVLDDVNKEFDEVIIRNCKNNRYIILSLSETTEKFKELLITNSKKFDIEVINYVLNCKNTKNKNEMNLYKKQTNI